MRSARLNAGTIFILRFQVVAARVCCFSGTLWPENCCAENAENDEATPPEQAARWAK